MIWIRTEKKILDLYLHAKPNRHRKVPKLTIIWFCVYVSADEAGRDSLVVSSVPDSIWVDP